MICETVHAQMPEPFHLSTHNAKSTWGLMTRIATNMTAHRVGMMVNALFGQPIPHGLRLPFQQLAQSVDMRCVECGSLQIARASLWEMTNHLYICKDYIYLKNVGYQYIKVSMTPQYASSGFPKSFVSWMYLSLTVRMGHPAMMLH